MDNNAWKSFPSFDYEHFFSSPVVLQPRTIRLENHTLKALKYWTWQFVAVRPICSILMIVCQVIGFYPSWLSWTFTIILNFSVSLALYALVIFYHVFAKELAPHRPLAKFMCIKGIVFFCFWQVGPPHWQLIYEPSGYPLFIGIFCLPIRA